MKINKYKLNEIESMIIDETKLATKLNPLNDRVTALETSMGDVQSRLENINGETV